MELLKRVVVGTDGSTEARIAADWAARWCLLNDLPMELLAVGGTVAAYARTTDRPNLAAMQEEFKELEARLEATAQEIQDANPGLILTTRVEKDVPAARLVAESSNETLLVIGTRGLGGAVAAMLGSVADQVVTHALGPVVVVPESAQRVPINEAISLGFDYGSSSLPAAEFAFGVAARTGQPLHVVAIQEQFFPGYGGVLEQNPMHYPFSAQDIKDHVVETLQPVTARFAQVDYQVHPQVGRPHEVLIQEASRGSLLVVGSRGRGGFTGLLLGSTSRSVLRRTPVPTVVVRDPRH